MKSKFSENIKVLRKQQGLTQEQLAEAMGVTVGAVYKWEQNLSTPDIRFIMELAHFFGVSVDALVGYEVQDGTAETYAKRIEALRQKKDYAAAVREAEQARLLDSLGRTKEAEEALQEALQVADRYDAAPTCRSDSVRFCISDSKTVYDDVGPSAMFAIEEQMEREQFSDALRTVWERLKAAK